MNGTVSAAAAWWVRRDARKLSAVDESAFQAWLEASEENRVAYERVRGTWGIFESMTHSASDELRREALAFAPQRRKWPLMAAAIVLAVLLPGLAMLLNGNGRRQTPIAATPPAVQHFSNAAEPVSTITLSDGTTVALGFKADIDVRFTATQRQVVLSRGEAFFAVSKDSRRPFSVDAGDNQVLAVGTQFDVRHEPSRVEVVLLEGRLSVRSAHNTQIDLVPGQRLIAASGDPPLVFKVDAERMTSWRRGWIGFDNESLTDAVEEFNRHATGHPIAIDPAVGSLRLGGVFRIGPPERFARVVEELLPVSAVSGAAGEIHLVPLKTKAAASR